MHLGFLNPQGNFDPADSYWTEHPDFGGQLVYVKNLSRALGALGHRVDILTRRVVDPDWPQFATPIDGYEDAANVRIVRLPCGDHSRFLRKEELWPYLGRDWVPAILDFYRRDGGLPEAMTGHYGDGGLAAVLLYQHAGISFTFTAHSLGAHKLDKLLAGGADLASADAQYHFGRRLIAERLAMNHAGVIVTSTSQERVEQYAHRAYEGAVDCDDAGRFAVVPPGVDLAVFAADVTAPDEHELQRRIEERLARDLDDDRLPLPAVIASSRIEPKKNHRALVEAFAASRPLRESANLVIITGAIEDPLGGAAEAAPAERAVLAELSDLIREHALHGVVSAFGLRGQQALAAAYRHLAQRRAVFALTSLYEPFGLAPLEAAAAGLPVVVTRNGGPRESLRDAGGDYGVLVDPADPDDIAAGLLRALGRDWDRLAAAGRRRVLDRYTWDRTAAGYLAAVEQASRAPSRRLLPIHPYLASGEGDVTLEQLKSLYRT